jgi:predicted lipoprotein with Yx(FWY)xxD motif
MQSSNIRTGSPLTLRPRMRIAAAALAVLGTIGIGSAAIGPSPASAQAKPSVSIKLADSKLGKILVGDKGLSLYMFTPDRFNVSNCEGQCLALWPPVMLGKGETLANVDLGDGLRRSKLGVAMREDGSRQVTYNGWALYYWVRDSVAGDVKGQWVGSVWFVLNEDGNAVSTHLQ